ncbi:hypothetical protein NESM_000020600 [Novymonas esmeraldas]|uniref:Uncharacterized protein n=1 Tax=Novymonas esmeraldas TaxID=1808958 RepID=A0AAW0F397_9TRYP
MIVGGAPAKRWATESVPELLASPKTSLETVLLSDTVVDYLQSIQTTPVTHATRRAADGAAEGVDGGPSTVPHNVHVVLRYIARNADGLFSLLQGKASLASFRPSAAVAAPDDPAAAAASHGASAVIAKARPLRGRRAAASRSSSSSASSPDSAGRHATDDDASAGSTSPNTPARPGDADDETQERRCLANLTEFLSFCIAHSPEQAEINAVVAACTTTLSVQKTLESQRTFAVQRLLLEAFDSDFETTTQTIADTLTPSIITGVVENLASNSIVAETLIALFGSALSAVWMVKPTTRTALFTSRWIQLGFPATLCAYLPIAIRDPGMYHYFYFFKELLKRGYSHSAGPVVDVLLGEPLVSDYVERILRCCEQDVGRSPMFTPEGAAASPVSLAADAMEVLVSIVSLVRKSVVLPETASMYAASTLFVTPVAVLQAQARRMTALLAPTAREVTEAVALGSSAAATPSSRSLAGSSRRSLPSLVRASSSGLGPLRLAVCELFVEFSLFQLASTDSTLITSGFFPAFIGCCERFPQHDALARALHRCILTVFKRALLVGETVKSAAERDQLWSYLVQPHTVVLRSGRAASVVGALTDLAQTPETALSSHCLDILAELAALPLFQAAAAGGRFDAHLDAFRACDALQERVRHMVVPITGERFEDRGSTTLEEPVHRDTINLAGDRYRGPKVGGPTRGSRFSSPSNRAGKGGYVIVRHSGDDDRPQRTTPEAAVDIEALKREVYSLQQASSPAVQSYPSFSNVHLGFFATTVADDEGEADGEAAAADPTPIAPPAASHTH